MITIAIDTATSRCSVAVDDGCGVIEAHIDGARRHTREVLGLVDLMLTECGAEPRDIGRVLSADGPGSFTGLRLATAVAKALVWNRPEVEWWSTPSLLVQAWPELRSGARVLALADALRGELYAGCWQAPSSGIIPIGPPPRATKPADLAEFGLLDAVVGIFPDALREQIHAATACMPRSSLPDARSLLALSGVPEGMARITEPGAWLPVYGRPAEAQAVWERKHERALPDSTYRTG